MARLVTARRSVVKAVTYRGIIVCLDFATVYILTGAAHVALGFTIVSNIYTTAVYLIHERVWARIKWGVEEG